MVPDRIWASNFFGSQEIWSTRYLFPKKMPYMDFHAGPSFLEPKFLGSQTSWGTKFPGAQKSQGPNEIEDHFSYSHFDPQKETP